MSSGPADSARARAGRAAGIPLSCRPVPIPTIRTVCRPVSRCDLAVHCPVDLIGWGRGWRMAARAAHASALCARRERPSRFQWKMTW